MGQLEAGARRKQKRKNIKALVLSTIGIAGMLGIAMVAPNVLGAMAKLGMIPVHRQKEIVNRARDRLVRDGLLRREGWKMRLTAKGKLALGRLAARDYQIPKPKRWDNKWRVLIFDIPNYRTGLRDKIRHTLVAIGFVRMQDSVWAYPYDCEDTIALLKADFKVGKDMLYMIVDELEGDRWLRVHFDIH